MAAGRRAFGRDFRLYFTSQVVSQLGTSFTQFALPLLVFKLTGSATNLALTTAATFVPYLLFGLVARRRRRPGRPAADDGRGRPRPGRGDLRAAGPVDHRPARGLAHLRRGLRACRRSGSCSTAASSPPCRASSPPTTSSPPTAGSWPRTPPARCSARSLAGVLLAVVPVANLLFVDSATFLLSALALLSIRESFNTGDPPTDDRTRRRRRGCGRSSATPAKGCATSLGHPVLRTISIMMALINFVGATPGDPARALRQGGARRRPTPRSASSTAPGRPASS